MTKLKRRPLWKRVLGLPILWYQHYKLFREPPISSRLHDAHAAWLYARQSVLPRRKHENTQLKRIVRS